MNVRSLLFFGILSCIAAHSYAQSTTDSAKHVTRSEVIVTGFPATRGETPVPVEKIEHREIENLVATQDIPKVIVQTPSTLYYSSTGTDLGYSYINLRGFDQRRLSVLVNGVPQNDPEDHNVYWIDMPDLLSSTSSIEVQRGAGSAFYGPPAIGGSINVQTSLSPIKELSFTAGYGSYNTRRYSVTANSGLFADKYIVYGKLSKVMTDGYRHFSFVDLNAYHLSIARFDDNLTLQANFYGGPFEDGLSYYGLFPDSTRSILFDREGRKYNMSDSYMYERRPEEREQFTQPHYELLSSWSITNDLTLHNTFFYVQGDGYYNYDGTWADVNYLRLTEPYATRYNFTPFTTTEEGFGKQLIQGYVGNKQFGWLPRMEYTVGTNKFSIGGEFRNHRSIHWSKLLFASKVPVNLPDDYHFTEFHGGKDIYSVYANAEIKPMENLNLLGTLQIISQKYLFNDEKPFFVDSASAASNGIKQGWMSNTFDVPLLFVNPRLGINYKVADNLSLFTSVSITNREPRLADYYNAEFEKLPNFEMNSDSTFDFGKSKVKPEQLLDIELGLNAGKTALTNDLSIGGTLTGYYMPFTDEIIKTGKVVGFATDVIGNAEKTLHYGVEIGAEFAYSDWLTVSGNVAFSHNEIKEFSAYEPTEDVPSAEGKTPIGFPSSTGSVMLSVRPVTGLQVTVTSRFVGSTYGDLANSRDYQNDAYTVFDGYLSYRFNDALGASFIDLKVQVNNLFDKLYTTYASPGTGFFVAAPRNIFSSIQIGI